MQPAVVHAHAYASMDVERLGGDGEFPDLSRVLCEDYYQTGTYPMPAVPAASPNPDPSPSPSPSPNPSPNPNPSPTPNPSPNPSPSLALA